MVGQGVSIIFSSFAIQNAAQIATDPESLGVRIGLSLLILLVALLLGPRIARSVSRVPALIETVRERRAGRIDAASGAEGAESSRDDEAPIQQQPTGTSRWLGGVVLVCIWVFALYLIGAIWFADAVISARQRDALLNALRAFLVNLGISVLIIILTLVVARALQKSLVASMRHGRVNGNLVVLAGRTAFTITVITGVIAILGIWGLGIALPVTLIGAVTVALTLSLQDILKNVVSGVYLLLERPFVIGDQITITPYTGVVENISIRVTALRTSKGERVLVPNGLLFSSAVVNNSFYQQRRVGLLVTLPDDGPDAVETARERILQTLKDLKSGLRTPAPEVSLVKASGGKVDMRAILWLPVTRSDERGGDLSDAMELVRAHLPEAEIVPLDPSLAD
jgi:small-conductance mechanosensitive channel